MTPDTCIEFTPAALGPGSPWDPTTDMPRYLARCIDAGERAMAYVYNTDEQNTTVCLPFGGGCVAIPNACIIDAETLPSATAKDARGHIVRASKSAANPGFGLVVTGELDPGMGVQLWGPEIFAAMA